MENLTIILKAQGRTQSWLAREISMHRVTLNKKISGVLKWTAKDREKIVKALRIPEMFL